MVLCFQTLDRTGAVGQYLPPPITNRANKKKEFDAAVAQAKVSQVSLRVTEGQSQGAVKEKVSAGILHGHLCNPALKA